MEVGLNHFLILSLLLFLVGLFGIMTRRNPLVILMGVELMLNAVNLSFVAFSQFYDVLSAQIATFFVMTISAGEAGVGLALIVLISQKWKNFSKESTEESAKESVKPSAKKSSEEII